MADSTTDVDHTCNEQGRVHPIEYKLLSLLKHGETLRIVLSRPPGENRFALGLEAEGLLGKSSQDLTRRVSILLAALRNQGVDYALTSPDRSMEVGAYTWVTIAPRIRDLSTAADGRLGFGRQASPPGSGGKVIRVPSLGAVPAPDLVSYATEFLDQEPSVELIQMAFTRIELDDQWEKLLSDSLDMKFSELMAVIGREKLGGRNDRFFHPPRGIMKAVADVIDIVWEFAH